MAGTTGVYWVGNDGNFYIKTSTSGGVKNLGYAGITNPNMDIINGLTRIDNPTASPQYGVGTDSADAVPSSGVGSVDSYNQTNGVTSNTDTPTVDPDAAERAALKSEILSKGGDINAIYDALFGDLDTLVKSRDAELETQYGDQFKKAGDQYAAAIPQIETSYAAVGAENSTDNTYAKVGAKKGFEDTTKTIGNNKNADKAKLGQYKNEQNAKFTADRDAASRNVSRADSTTDVDALRGMRNDIETNLSGANVTRATLGTDGSARKTLSDLTADNGRLDAAINALDGILKSSLSGGVKQAAVKAVTDSAGLSDEEKKKVQETYGNVYAEQAAL